MLTPEEGGRLRDALTAMLPAVCDYAHERCGKLLLVRRPAGVQTRLPRRGRGGGRWWTGMEKDWWGRGRRVVKAGTELFTLCIHFYGCFTLCVLISAEEVMLHVIYNLRN